MSHRLRLFISSPGDVPNERLRAELIVDKLGQDYRRSFTLETYRWEHEPMIASGHFQDAIDPPSACDIVVLILWSRLGTPLPERTALREYRGIDGRAPVTGTEWEYEDALKAARERGAPDILAFRNLTPAPVDTDDPVARARSLAQLDALDAFWSRHFADREQILAAFAPYRSLDEFASLLEQSLRKLIERRIEASAPSPDGAPATAWPGAPFRGLEAYEFEHAAIFFGRDGVVAQAAQLLAARARDGTAFLLVSGASGSGKSSLVKAALVPRLMKPQTIVGAAFLRRAVFRPSDGGGDLILGLAEALTRGSARDGVGLPELLAPGQRASDLAAHMRASADGLPYILANALSRVTEDERRAGRLLAFEQAKLILVVDQLEELFTRAGVADQDRRLFARLLGGMSGAGGVWIVATLRNDFWHRAAEIPELAALAAGSGRLDVASPSPAELAEIIRKPVLAAGLSFETHPETGLGLDAVLAEHAADEPGVLPLLSFTLDALYAEDVVEAGGRVLTFGSYEALGGLKGAIAKRADEIVAALPEAAQRALPRLLRALTTTSDGADPASLARPAPLADFPPGAAARALVDALVAARLLVAADEGEVPTVRLAHEALISHWRRARVQLAEDRRDIETRKLIENQHRRWETAADAAKPSRLLRDPDLANARDLARRWGDELPEPLRKFIDLSDRAARAATRRRWLAAAVVIACLAALAAASLGALAIAQMQRDDALIAQSRSLSRDARAAIAAGDAALGIELALAALPKDLRRPDRPFVREAGHALADAYANLRERADLAGHQDAVNAIAFSPDGARVVTASDDGTARIWSVADPGESIALTGHAMRVYSAAFSPDGARVVTASEDHTARLWDAATGAAIGPPLAMHGGTVAAAVYSGDGARIVTASWDGTARIWDARTGGDLGELPCHAGKVLSASFSPDGKAILTVSEDGDAQIWDAASRQLLRTLSQAHESVNAAAFSPDGALVVAAADDGVARLWDAHSGDLAHALVGHSGRILAAAFSPDGGKVVTAAADDSARIWNVATGALEHTLLGHQGPVYAVAFSPDGRRVATAGEDRTARLWDAASGTASAVLGGHAGAVLALAFSPGGSELATASRDRTARLWSVETAAFVAALPGNGGAVVGATYSNDGSQVATATAEGAAQIWNARDGAPLARLGDPGAGVNSVAFSPDGARVVTASARHAAEIWNARTGEAIAALESQGGGAGATRTASFSPDDRYVVTVPSAGPPRLWDARSGAELGALTGHDGAVATAVFSRDAKLILTASADATARLWDVQSRQTLVVLAGHAAALKSAAFSPDATRVVTASLDKTARLWDARTGRPVATPLQHGNVVESAAFSADGKRVVTVSLDHTAAIWDAETAARIARIEGQGNATLWSAAFSPDGARIVTASDDRTAAIWDAATGERIATLQGHRGAVSSAAFSPDGAGVLTASSDGTARLWRAPPPCQALIDAARRQSPRELTPAERARYFVAAPRAGGPLALYDAMQPLLALVSPAAGDACR